MENETGRCDAARLSSKIRERGKENWTDAGRQGLYRADLSSNKKKEERGRARGGGLRGRTISKGNGTAHTHTLARIKKKRKELAGSRGRLLATRKSERVSSPDDVSE